MVSTLSEKIRRFDPGLPLEKASTIPPDWYLDPDIYRLERDTVFAKSWQYVARASQLEHAGGFVTEQVAGEPVVVVRDKDLNLQAFSNVCRHRAARLATACEGKASFFQCRYHGWTYDLKGQLKGAPFMDGVQDFSRDKIMLPKWSVETWGPLVFVQNSPSPKTSAAQWLQPLGERANEASVSKLNWVGRKEYTLECNWKLFVDNYLDGGYHVNTLHPALAGVLDDTKYKIEVFEHSSVQTSPLVGSQAQLEGIRIDEVRKGTEAQYWWFFPNLMINLYDGVMDTNLVLPLGPNRCRVLFDFFFAESESPAAKQFIENSLAVAHKVQLEDVEICEEVHRGLASQSYPNGRFSVRREASGYQFHRMLASCLQNAL